MWWPRLRQRTGALARLGGAIGLAAMTAGCFQPLYGDRSVAGGPGLRTAMASVDVAQINAPPGTPMARLAVELRNELLFELTGGGAPLPPAHRLHINLAVSGTSLVVDPTTGRPEYEIMNVSATYRLVELPSNKMVAEGSATSSATYNIPGQQQRFAMLRGQRDAQSRAAKVVAEQIRTRLASYFAAGT